MKRDNSYYRRSKVNQYGLIYVFLLFIYFKADFFHDAYPDRFAIDYASGNIFYTSVPVRSNGFVGVGVVMREGKHRKIITNADSPRAIALDSKEGYVFANMN